MALKTAVLVDGVGKCMTIERETLPKSVMVWGGRSFVLDLSTVINGWPVYRLDGYSPAPLRWKAE